MAIPYNIGNRSAFVDNYSNWLNNGEDLEEQYVEDLANEKSKNLGVQRQGSSYGEGYSQFLGNEYSNANKNYNYLTPGQLNTVQRNANDKYGVERGEDGLLRLPGQRVNSFDNGEDTGYNPYAVKSPNLFNI